MTRYTPPRAMPELVDLQNGCVSREIFVNEAIYQQEQEQVFARAWLFIGHESQLPNPGDYFVTAMGEESVLLTRDSQGGIRAFLNTCRHRGMKVCRYDEGHTTVFTCPYHGWSYGTDGRLVGVPYYREAYQEQLDRSQWGLIEVAQLENFKGSLWATWDKEAPPFYAYLGDMKRYLDVLLDCRDGREGGSEVLGGIHLLGRVGTVFPHMSFLSRQPRSIAVWHPRGALKTEAWRWFLVDQDAPPEVKDVLRHYYIRYSGPGGLTEQDDMENWNYASVASKGTIARRYPYNYQMGLGYEGTHPAVPGVVTVGISEQNQRGFYRRWAEFMVAQSWADLAPAGVGASARGK